MNIAVYGPGALGCLFAARLHEAGHAVQLVDHRPDRAARLNTSGLVIESAQGERTVRVPVTSLAAQADLALILVKSAATPTLALPERCPVLSLQNGLGNAEALCALAGASRVLAGTTAEASTLLAEGRIRHVAAGPLWLGAWTDCPAHPALAALQSAGFDARHAPDPREALWAKTILNAAVNPLTALLDVPNGQLLDSAYARHLVAQLAAEAGAVAEAEGYCAGTEHAARAAQVCADTAGNISSMLQDIRAGRPTEIEAISGEVLRRAQQAGVTAPATGVAYALVRALESRV